MLDINYIKLKIKIKLLQDCKLPRYKAYILMRNIKNLIFKNNCIKDGSCKNCEFNKSCVVINTIESKNGTNAPFIIECFDERLFLNEGDILEFDFLLFGRTIIYLSHYIYFFDMMGDFGLKHRKNKFKLINICNEDKKTIYEEGFFYKQNINIKTIQNYVDKRKESLNYIKEIEFMTPFRFLNHGELTDFLDFKDMVNFVYKRLFILNTYASNEVKKIVPDIEGEIGGGYREWADIKGIDKQKSYIKLGGVTGKIQFSEEVNLIKDYIIACELAHIGENTSFGLGKFKILEN